MFVRREGWVNARPEKIFAGHCDGADPGSLDDAVFASVGIA